MVDCAVQSRSRYSGRLDSEWSRFSGSKPLVTTSTRYSAFTSLFKNHPTTTWYCEVTNATGSAKVPISIIAKAKNPRCFRRKSSPIKYFVQNNTWSDGATFRKWWLEVFLPLIRRWAHFRVLCLMDGCASHVSCLVDPKGQVKTMVYPPYCTSKHQPMYMGIIAATKLHYRRSFLSVRVSTMAVTDTLRPRQRSPKWRPVQPG